MLERTAYGMLTSWMLESQVRYLPLYMLPLVAKELSKGSLEGVVAQPPTW
jgi:hypothetical protein